MEIVWLGNNSHVGQGPRPDHDAYYTEERS